MRTRRRREHEADRHDRRGFEPRRLRPPDDDLAWPCRMKPARKAHRYPWWLETLAATGTAALIGGILSLFFAVGRRPGTLWATEAPPVDSPAFLASISGAAGAPLRTGGTVQLLNNGVQIFPSMLEA